MDPPDKRKVRYGYDAFARRIRKQLVRRDATYGTEAIPIDIDWERSN